MPITLDTTPTLFGIIADGQRIAVAGALFTHTDGQDDLGSAVPAVWLSEDGNTAWQRSVFNDPGTSGFAWAAVYQRTIALIGTSGTGSTVVWHNQPDGDSNDDADGQ
jgi:hypothetical protein